MQQKFFLLSLFICTSVHLFAQHSGNHLTDNNNAYTSQPGVNRLYLSDSSFVIQAKVMTNIIADTYVITFGVTEYAKTLKEANTQIDQKITKFIAALKSGFGGQVSDVYVDMTTQTQVSDYKVNGNYAEQFVSGYEQKKNIIFRLKSVRDLDKIVTLASEHDIYDLAKVDYIVTDINSVYTQLFQAATDIIQSKKMMYAKATNVEIKRSSQIYGESFYSFSPAQLYKSYTPNVSKEYVDYGNFSKRKDLRKNTTYFYDHINHSGFDKVINPIVTEPTVEYILVLQIRFDIER